MTFMLTSCELNHSFYFLIECDVKPPAKYPLRPKMCQISAITISCVI